MLVSGGAGGRLRLVSGAGVETFGVVDRSDGGGAATFRVGTVDESDSVRGAEGCGG